MVLPWVGCTCLQVPIQGSVFISEICFLSRFLNLFIEVPNPRKFLLTKKDSLHNINAPLVVFLLCSYRTAFET